MLEYRRTTPGIKVNNGPFLTVGLLSPSPKVGSPTRHESYIISKLLVVS